MRHFPGRFDRLKLTINETTGCTATVHINTNQQARLIRVRFIMGKWLAFQIGIQPLVAHGAVYGIETFGQRPGSRVAA